MAKRNRNNGKNRVAYAEFGAAAEPDADVPTVELSPAEQKILVQVSRKGRKGKTVTIASGFQCQSATLTKLLKQLKGRCGSGGTVKDQTLEIQGDHRETVQQQLKQLGYKVR
ncbi:MAG: translation initiation factor [Spirulina sp. SIO3F2]|nr:translation initiation factor [Spirulina sp. SIO3F2]